MVDVILSTTERPNSTTGKQRRFIGTKTRAQRPQAVISIQVRTLIEGDGLCMRLERKIILVY